MRRDVDRDASAIDVSAVLAKLRQRRWAESSHDCPVPPDDANLLRVPRYAVEAVGLHQLSRHSRKMQMTRFKQTAFAASVAFALGGTPMAEAVSTDGYHTIQIIPIAVQTTSFSSSFFFHNPNANSIDVEVTYYPAVSTATASAVSCGTKSIAANSVATYATLTALCPGITSGANFGWLYTREASVENKPYAIFTRVDNPLDQGFEIESYAAHHFTAATAHVTGLKRTEAAPGALSNCFIGALGEATTLQVSLWSGTNAQIGTTQTYSLAANEFRRLFDIFTIVGAPPGDYANVRMEVFEDAAASEPGHIAFCTVQNNTTFDADFRIAKAFPVADGHALRGLIRAGDVNGTFTLGNFPNNRNRHIYWFKHPDWVQCSVNRTNGATAALEMRLVANDAITPIAGGNNTQSFGKVFLGTKSTRGGGQNTFYYIEVEGADAGSSGATYEINCQAGSGIVGGEIVTRDLTTAF
jgi:hypothetical protein